MNSGRGTRAMRAGIEARSSTMTSSMLKLRLVAASSALLSILPPNASAQAGDHKGEEQPPLPPGLVVPPSPALTAAEESATFALPPGLKIELVACEPLIHDPIQAVFDESGRLWVVEMSGYMPDVDGRAEREPVGSIVVLEDTDGDGRMDRRTVFARNLVLPRAVAPVSGGALMIVPPRLVQALGEDGALSARSEIVIDTNLAGLDSPEHAINGLVWMLDNWFHCANSEARYREIDGQWVKRPTAGGGQWGITCDDFGRVFFNDNSDPLRYDGYPSHYAVRNRNLGRAGGVNLGVAHETHLFPARVTPGVNRGYQRDVLRDFKLAQYTAACAPHVYRGDALPADMRGDVFLCEPAANLMKRYKLSESPDGHLRAEDVYSDREVLTSTDERFRPVNLADGPDGALYVVDMYRGVIQHRLFVTSFLRQQVIERKLEHPIGLGRIWRIVPQKSAPRAFKPLRDASFADLVATLSDPNGWRRDTAQRLIVEEGATSAELARDLRELALKSNSQLARIHALWSLEGLGKVDEDLLVRALEDRDPRVLAAAVRVGESTLARGETKPVARLEVLSLEVDTILAGTDRDSSKPAKKLERFSSTSGLRELSLQILHSLGEAHTEQADRALAKLLAADSRTRERREAILSGLYQRELEFLERFLELLSPSEHARGEDVALSELAQCIVRDARSDRIGKLLDSAAALPIDRGWQARALLDGVLSARSKRADGTLHYIPLGAEPVSLRRLCDATDTELRAKARQVGDALAWPGKPGLAAESAPTPLDARQMKQFESGRAIFAAVCSGCHQSSGLGEEGKAPPLRDSVGVLGSPERLARILLFGMEGELARLHTNAGQDMPALGASDEDIAAVLTYIRREWGNGADPIDAETVRSVRAANSSRKMSWRASELEELLKPAKK
jgi:mono/diheme cytochrome c family protein/glucose/arabinose dehydrogenase